MTLHGNSQLIDKRSVYAAWRIHKNNSENLYKKSEKLFHFYYRKWWAFGSFAVNTCSFKSFRTSIVCEPHYLTRFEITLYVIYVNQKTRGLKLFLVVLRFLSIWQYIVFHQGKTEQLYNIARHTTFPNFIKKGSPVNCFKGSTKVKTQQVLLFYFRLNWTSHPELCLSQINNYNPPENQI